MEQANIEPIKLTIWSVAKYACRGVPILENRLDYSWQRISTPKFPLAFTFLGIFFYILPPVVVELFDVVSKDSLRFSAGVMLGDMATPICVIFCVIFGINLLILGWCFLILFAFKKITSSRHIQVIQESQRAIYFSTFFQPFILLLLSLLGIQIGGLGFGLTPNLVLYLLLFGVCILRVFALFQGMRRNAKGNGWVGLCAIVFCVDAWYGLFILFIILFHASLQTVELFA